jgi:hypothetical protein
LRIVDAYPFIKNWRFEVEGSSIDLESISSSNLTPIPWETTLTTLPLTVMSFSAVLAFLFQIYWKSINTGLFDFLFRMDCQLIRTEVLVFRIRAYKKLSGTKES